jgi:N-acetylmuramoyl-L-alanine amidase/Putative peptidoglycan binding domain
MCTKRGRSRQLDRGSFIKLSVGMAGLAIVGRSSIVLPGDAYAAPTIADCNEWGARAPKAPISLTRRPNKIIIHHTAGPNNSDTSQGHAFSLARSIQNTHMDVRGWKDTGQHFTVSRGGYVTEGRHRSLEVLQRGQQHVIGAHCEGQNTQAVGIENEGTYMEVQPPTLLQRTLVDLCTYICTQYAISPQQIYGHRDFYNTACPGDMLYALLPQLRDQVAAQTGVPTSLRTPPPPPVQYAVLKVGSTGEAVGRVQRALRIPDDGIFGNQTRRAVLRFQQDNHLRYLDGEVGPETAVALAGTTGGAVLKVGSRGDAVARVQRALRIPDDGIFGNQTRGAVLRFQQDNHLQYQDGKVGPETTAALF